MAKKSVTTIRLMQTRSLEHLWNQQRRQPELTLHEFMEMLKVKPIMVYFFRRDSDQSTGCPQQRLMIRVNDHISVELRCRTFIYNCRDGGCVELFAIGGICEIVTPCLEGMTVMSRECKIELLDWNTVKDINSVANIEKTLLDKIAEMKVTYAIEYNTDVFFVRSYLNERKSIGDQQVPAVIRAFNRIVNPEKYISE